MPRTICFYHGDDLDGFASAAVVRHFHPDAELVPIVYDAKFPFELADNNVVIMVDFSLKPDGMKELLARTDEFIWIDHHAVIIDKIKNTMLDAVSLDAWIPGLRESGRAACELAWTYFAKTAAPYGLYLLGRWDVHDLSDPHVSPFQYGMRSLVTDPRDPASNELWRDILGENHRRVSEIIVEGGSIERYALAELASYAKRFAYWADLKGVPAIAINRARGGSDLFRAVATPERPLWIAYAMLPDGGYIVSLYSDDERVHCGMIAELYGGSGHKGAAGFIWPRLTLPWRNEFTTPAPPAEEVDLAGD